jgi:hypothetical protein
MIGKAAFFNREAAFLQFARRINTLAKHRSTAPKMKKKLV